MRLRLQNLERIYKQSIMLCVDIFTLFLALWISFVLRLGDIWPSIYIEPAWWLFLVFPIVMIPLFIKLGLYRAVLQYIGIKVITTTVQATTISCLIIGFFMMVFREEHVPRSVLPILWLISSVSIKHPKLS